MHDLGVLKAKKALTSRVLILILYSTVYSYWVFLVVVLHWITMMLWVLSRYATIKVIFTQLYLHTYMRSDKKERKVSSYIRKFRWDRLQSHKCKRKGFLLY